MLGHPGPGLVGHGYSSPPHLHTVLLLQAVPRLVSPKAYTDICVKLEGKAQGHHHVMLSPLHPKLWTLPVSSLRDNLSHTPVNLEVSVRRLPE